MTTFAPPPLLTREDMLDLLRRNMDPLWIDGLLEDPSSSSVFEGMIAVMLRVQDAIDENFSLQTFISTATGAFHAASTVRLQRPSGADVIVPVNFRFGDDRGEIWYPVAETTIPASIGVQTFDLAIRSARSGEWLDTFLPLIFVDVDDLASLDVGLVIIDGDDPAQGGKTPFLDQHGKEREVFRAPGEEDDLYRARMVEIEDVATPIALTDAALYVLDAFPTTKRFADLITKDGFRFLREPFRDSAQTYQRGLEGSETPYLDDAFLDDPSAYTTRSFEDALAWFDILLPTLIDPDEPRLFVDDGYLDDPEFGYADLPPADALTAPIAALADELDRRRAGGVRFRVIVGEDIDLERRPPLASLTQAGDWLAQDGLATDPSLVGAQAKFSADDLYAKTTTGAGPGAPFQAGDLIFGMPALNDAPDGLTRVVLRCWARRASTAVGTDPQLAFVMLGERISVDMFPRVIDHTDWREYRCILDENPVSAAPWAVSDVSTGFPFGVANMAAVGPTDEIRVADLTAILVSDYG